MWCFAASTLDASFAPCSSGEVCQLVARHLLWRRAVGLSHRLHQRCILPFWLWSQVTHILCDGRELPRSILDCRCKVLVVPATQAVGPVRRTNVIGRTEIDKHELSVVIDPHQHVPQAQNGRQRCDGSSCSAQLRLLSSECHLVTFGHQPCYRQDRTAHINHLKRHFRR